MRCGANGVYTDAAFRRTSFPAYATRGALMLRLEGDHNGLVMTWKRMSVRAWKPRGQGAKDKPS